MPTATAIVASLHNKKDRPRGRTFLSPCVSTPFSGIEILPGLVIFRMFQDSAGVRFQDVQVLQGGRIFRPRCSSSL